MTSVKLRWLASLTGAAGSRTVTIREHYIGVGIIALTLLICTWVLVRGLAPKGLLWGAYDPALFGGPAIASEPVGTVAAGKAKLLPVGDPSGKVEIFDAENLYEKIDGRAESFLEYNVQSLECCSETLDGQPAADVYVYDHGAPLMAFGMFSSERAGGEEAVKVGQEGYRSAASVFFWKDRYYCQVLVDEDTPAKAEAALRLAKALDAKIPEAPFEVPGRAFFPTEGLRSDTLRYVAKNALGQEFLTDTYSATYEVDGVKVESFVSRRANEAEAGELLAKYRAFLATVGEAKDETVDGVPMVVLDKDGTVDIVFQRGPYLAGVTYVSGRTAAVAIASRLAASLKP